jgi:hypothetical protein
MAERPWLLEDYIANDDVRLIVPIVECHLIVGILGNPRTNRTTKVAQSLLDHN